MTENALLGLHGDPLIRKAFSRCLAERFSVKHAFDVEQMLAYCRESRYGLYVMDLNLGKEAALDITPARAVYNLLQEQKIEGLELKFVGVSSKGNVVEMAQRAGLPAVLKPSFLDYFREHFP